MDNITKEKKENKEPKPDFVSQLHEYTEIACLTVAAIMLVFAFVVRLNVVDGSSMLNTLLNKDVLLVVDDTLYNTPQRGDIVVVHDVSAYPYDRPIVKRVIATEGQTVDIDFETWTLTVDGEVVEEDYRYLDGGPILTAGYAFPITVPEGEVFVLGDNRNNSADSRVKEIGTVDTRCVVGHALVRLSPLNRICLFTDPYKN